jgi:hypothetical protein
LPVLAQLDQVRTVRNQLFGSGTPEHGFLFDLLQFAVELLLGLADEFLSLHHRPYLVEGSCRILELVRTNLPSLTPFFSEVVAFHW